MQRQRFFQIFCIFLILGYVNSVRIHKRLLQKTRGMRVDKAHEEESRALTFGGMEDCCDKVIPELLAVFKKGKVDFAKEDDDRYYLTYDKVHRAVMAISLDADDYKNVDPKVCVELSLLAADGTVKSAGPFMFFKAMCEAWKLKPTATTYVLHAASINVAAAQKFLPLFDGTNVIEQTVLEKYYTTLGMQANAGEQGFSGLFKDVYPKCLANTRVSTKEGSTETRPLFSELETKTEGDGENIKLTSLKVISDVVIKEKPAEAPEGCKCIIA